MKVSRYREQTPEPEAPKAVDTQLWVVNGNTVQRIYGTDAEELRVPENGGRCRIFTTPLAAYEFALEVIKDDLEHLERQQDIYRDVVLAIV